LDAAEELLVVERAAPPRRFLEVLLSLGRNLAKTLVSQASSVRSQPERNGMAKFVLFNNWEGLNFPSLVAINSYAFLSEIVFLGPTEI